MAAAHQRLIAEALLKAEKKLEAVKKWHKAQLGRQVNPTDIRELGQILEVEGVVGKDLITECTAQEFRDWMRDQGLNIDFISDRTLDAEDPKFRHDIRRAFLLDLIAKKEAEAS